MHVSDIRRRLSLLPSAVVLLAAGIAGSVVAAGFASGTCQQWDIVPLPGGEPLRGDPAAGQRPGPPAVT